MTGLARIFSRLAALGLLAAVLGGVWLYVVGPVTAHVQETGQSIALNEQLVERLAGSIGNRDAQAARIAALSEQIARSRQYIQGETEPLAAAAMRELLQRVLGQADVQIRSFQDLPATQEIGLTRVNVRVVLEGSFDGLVAALYRLETLEPHLFIDDLRLKAASMRRRARNRNRNNEQQPKVRLSAVFQLSGFIPPKVSQ